MEQTMPKVIKERLIIIHLAERQTSCQFSNVEKIAFRKQPKISFVKIKTRVSRTDDTKGLLMAYRRAFNYKWFHSLRIANQISHFN